MELPVVRCEKLIAVADSSAPNWWLKMLDIEDIENGSIFDDGGRIEIVEESAVVETTLTAHRRGYNPIVLCASPATRKRLHVKLSRQGRVGRFLVRGLDDEQILFLLLHPSRDVLLGWIGKKRLLVPTKAYYEALVDWLEHDAFCQEFRRRVDQQDIRLIDFQLIAEPDVDNDSARQIYEFHWGIDPSRKLELRIYLDTHQAQLLQSVAQEPAGNTVQMGPHTLRFDHRGICELDGSALAWLVEQFRLPETYLYWDDINYGPSLIDQLRVSVEEWWNGTSESFSGLLTPERWNLLAPLLGLNLARSPVRTTTPPGTQREPVEAVQLGKPILRMIEDEPKLQFEVQWRTLNLEAAPLLVHKAEVVITGLNKRVEYDWDDQNCRILTIYGGSLPRPYRYAYAWDAAHNTLKIHMAMLWESSATFSSNASSAVYLVEQTGPSWTSEQNIHKSIFWSDTITLVSEAITNCINLARNMRRQTNPIQAERFMPNAAFPRAANAVFLPNPSNIRLHDDTYLSEKAGYSVHPSEEFIAILLVNLYDQDYELEVFLIDEMRMPITQGSIKWHYNDLRDEAHVRTGRVRILSCQSGTVQLTISIPDRDELNLSVHFIPSPLLGSAQEDMDDNL